jgi:TatD DNase family protein
VSQASKSEVDTGLRVLAELAPKAAAIGEIGLDRSSRYDGTQARVQQKLAVEQALLMSKKADKPLILHVVQALSQMIDLLDRWGPFPRGGMVHGFTGSPEIAQEYLKRGFLISIGKGILKLGYIQLKKTALQLREDQILLETDSAEPAELIAVAEALAELRGCSQSDLLKRTSLNLSRIFEIQGP